MTLPPDVKARVLEAARGTSSATRGTTRTREWLVLPSGLIVAASLYFAFGGVEHGAGRPAWFHAASALGWAGIAALSMWSAVGGGGSATGRARSLLWIAAVGTPAVLFAMMFALAAIDPALQLAHAERLGVKCFGLTVAAAAFPLLALVRVRRGSDAVHPAASGAALGAACGASAGVMVEMWCPVAETSHVVIGHIAPVALLAVLGALLGVRFLAMRGRTRGASSG